MSVWKPLDDDDTAARQKDGRLLGASRNPREILFHERIVLKRKVGDNVSVFCRRVGRDAVQEADGR